MRRLAYMVVALLALSFALAPFNTVHVHIAADHGHSVLHGGHAHDSQHGHAVPGETLFEHIVAVKLTASDHGAASQSAQWMPMLWILVALTMGIAAIREVFRPPGRDSRRLIRRSWRLPPLRGPPLFSI